MLCRAVLYSTSAVLVITCVMLCTALCAVLCRAVITPYMCRVSLGGSGGLHEPEVDPPEGPAVREVKVGCRALVACFVCLPFDCIWG